VELFGVNLIGVSSQLGETLIFTAEMLVRLGLLRVSCSGSLSASSRAGI
jgi:hypothetical protein